MHTEVVGHLQIFFVPLIDNFFRISELLLSSESLLCVNVHVSALALFYVSAVVFLHLRTFVPSLNKFLPSRFVPLHRG